MTDLSETEFLYSVNQTLQKSPQSTQRDFARATNMSLGMTNAVLKRFAQKGWIIMKKVNPRTSRYVLTSAGMSALEERTRTYMERTFRSIKECTAGVEERISRAKQAGCSAVVLYGESDISFLIEYASVKYGMTFVENKSVPAEIPVTEHTLVLAGEQVSAEESALLREAGAKGVWEEVKE